MQFYPENIPFQEINSEIISKQEIRLFVLRLDLIHPTVTGNKYFKLKYNLEEAAKQNKNTLITFGGAYSNHIVATAAAGKIYGFNTVGIIRGEQNNPLNSYLQCATDCGMKLHYVSRGDYKLKQNGCYYASKKNEFSKFYFIPEGGSNELAILGCKEIIENIPIDFDTICCACGTGATFSGILISLKEEQKALGFQILKGKNYMKKEVEKWLTHFNLQSKDNWSIREEFHFGGYGKSTPNLLDFKSYFEETFNIPLDSVYTSKLMFGVVDLISKGYFKKGETVVVVHTGGLIGALVSNRLIE